MTGTAIQNPGYRRLLETGALAARVAEADRRLEDCDLCARYCRVDRKRTIKGAVCRTGDMAVVYSFGAHHGEEDCLRGRRGSGTVFFSHCNLRCEYCQNWDISRKGAGHAVTNEELAAIFLSLQAQGCHNVNLVSPSHVVAQVLAAVQIAAERGLTLPIVYNTGGYDSPEALALLDGVVDIYMPYLKYAEDAPGHSYSHVRDYATVNRAAIKEMHRQVGDLVTDAHGLAVRGLLVRHLVLPNDVAGSDAAFAFLAEDVSPDTYVNIMDQYRPCYRAQDFPALDRPVSRAEYRAAIAAAGRHGLTRLDPRNVLRP
ncbi:MAG: radical SAM protein [Alphaproteobacteria bacterium]|jgi:putative pyruvate formate lyase activating enzyme|nr:radical SAM protein [Alphaproteobacteria bacterium]